MGILTNSIYSPTSSDYSRDEARSFLAELERRKDDSFRAWKDSLGLGDIVRLFQINDFVFQLFRDMWFVQRNWFDVHGRYFQGLPSALVIPEYYADSHVNLIAPTDQLDGWADLGLLQLTVPVQFWCDMYQAPDGHGYKVLCLVRVNDHIWANQMHQGPEFYRSSGNFRWQIMEDEVAMRFPLTVASEIMQKMKKIEVFISYRSDARSWAERLFRALGEYEDRTVFLPRLDIVDLKVGNWIRQLEDLIVKAEIFMPLLTPGYLNGPFAVQELDLALREAFAGRTTKRLVPVLLRGRIQDYAHTFLGGQHIITTKGSRFTSDSIDEIAKFSIGKSWNPYELQP